LLPASTIELPPPVPASIASLLGALEAQLVITALKAQLATTALSAPIARRGKNRRACLELILMSSTVTIDQ
jgi:hypothetical protein